MSLYRPFSIYVFLSLLFVVFNVHSIDDNSSESLPISILGHTHDHSENLYIPRKVRKRPLSSVGNTNYTMLITGGFRKNARDNEMDLTKYIVSIRTLRPTAYFGDNHFCVGVIISEQLVLTAAHCVVDRRRIVIRAHRLLVIAGTPNRLQRENSTVVRKVDEIFVHHDYVSNSLHDIAILRLAERLPDFSRYVEVMPMTDKPPVAGTTCNIVGWGQLFFRGPYTAVSVQANLTIISSEECKNFYPHIYEQSVICAGHPKEWDADICRGDSGGPLICDNKVTAVVSWSSHCGEKGKPTIFTSVYHHLDWIHFANQGNALRTISFFYLMLIKYVMHRITLIL